MGEEKKRKFAAFILKEMEKLPKEEAYCSPMTVVCIDGVVKTSSLMMIALCPWITKEDLGDVSLILIHCGIKMKEFEKFLHCICTTEIDNWYQDEMKTFTNIAHSLQINNYESSVFHKKIETIVLDKSSKIQENKSTNELLCTNTDKNCETGVVIETNLKTPEKIVNESNNPPPDNDIEDDEGPINFNCPSCSYRSSVLAVLHQHIRTTHEETVTCFQCDICKFSTKNENSFQKHMDTHVETLPKSSSQEENILISKELSPVKNLELRTKFLLVTTSKGESLVEQQGSENVLVKTMDQEEDHDDPLMVGEEEDPLLDEDGCVKCRHCSTFFRYSRSLCHHLKSVHDEKCSECAVNVSEVAATTTQPIANRIPCMEPGCNKVFPNAGLLATHKKWHDPVRMLPKCRKCRTIFSTEAEVSIHMNENPNCGSTSCGVCGNVYTSIYTLKRHMQSHTGERPYKCHICSKAFTQRPVLMDHLILHTGQKRFKCSQCEKSFQQKNHLKYHMLAAHNIGKRHSCSACAKEFPFQHQLVRHQKKIHGITVNDASKRAQYVCPDCPERSFVTDTNYRHHRKTVHGQLTNDADIVETKTPQLNVNVEGVEEIEDGQLVRMEEGDGEFSELVVENVCVGEDGTLVWKTGRVDTASYQIFQPDSS